MLIKFIKVIISPDFYPFKTSRFGVLVYLLWCVELYSLGKFKILPSIGEINRLHYIMIFDFFMDMEEDFAPFFGRIFFKILLYETFV